MSFAPTTRPVAGPAAFVPDLVLKGVAHTYRSALSRPVVALTPTDLTIDSGAVVALVGPAGSGKTTLMEILAGRRLPTDGEVLLGGEPVVGPGRRTGVVIRPADGRDLRAQIAQTLAVDTGALLLDEPFAGMSAPEREDLQEHLYAIWKCTGRTMVLATRRAADTVPLATRVVVLSRGPGEIVTDVHVDFARRDQPLGVLRADPELASFSAHLRVA